MLEEIRVKKNVTLCQTQADSCYTFAAGDSLGQRELHWTLVFLKEKIWQSIQIWHIKENVISFFIFLENVSRTWKQQSKCVPQCSTKKY